MIGCKKKCKSCTTTSSNCLECTGSYRSTITPNCNCSEGYYEPMNSGILSCLSNLFYFSLIFILSKYLLYKQKILITIYFIIECSDKCQTCENEKSNCTSCTGKYRIAPGCIC